MLLSDANQEQAKAFIALARTKLHAAWVSAYKAAWTRMVYTNLYQAVLHVAGAIQLF